MTTRLLVLLTMALAAAACDGTTDDPGRTDSGPAPASDAGPETGRDGGPTTGDDGGPPLGDPAEVNITFGGCADLTPCGGDPTGTWDYTSVCVEDPFAAVGDACGDVTFRDVRGTARGRVVLDGATVTRDATVTIEATAVLGPGCAVAGCDVVEDALAMAVDSASCAPGSMGGCDCDVSQTSTIDNSDTYRVEGNEIVTGDGGRYDFCRTGSTLAYREQGDRPDEPGFYELAAR